VSLGLSPGMTEYSTLSNYPVRVDIPKPAGPDLPLIASLNDGAGVFESYRDP
jgi:hypothetical protein